MNEHPQELLAGYVDGTLDDDERAAVDAHVAACETCREEVELARGARSALGGLPQVGPPPGIEFRVRRRATMSPRTVRTVAAVAAGVILGGGLVLALGQLDLGQDSAETSGQTAEPASAPEAEAGGGGGAEGVAADEEDTAFTGSGKASSVLAAPPILPVYEESKKDYASDELAPLARRLRDDANAAIKAGLAPNARRFFEEFEPEEFIPDVQQAIRCVLTDVPPTQLVVPFRIEAASFQGAPAYIAAFLQGPTPDDPYDRVVIWVVEQEGCGLISLASQVL